jgi:hypothetical protein
VNKKIIIASVLILAIGLEISGAIFSVIGLTSLFAGAELQVFVIASLLEASKLVLASYLHSYWNNVNKIIRVYLTSALVIIAMITSFGIYGSLIGAYQKTKIKTEIANSGVSQFETKIIYFESTLKNIDTQLSGKLNQLSTLQDFRSTQESRSDKLVGLNRSTRSVDNALATTTKQINELNYDIDSLNRSKIVVMDSITTMNIAITNANLQNQQSSELGAMSFIAATFNIPIDTLVNILIIVLLFVIDPLAICMIVVYNSLANPIVKDLEFDPENHTKTPRKPSIDQTKDTYISTSTPIVHDEENSVQINLDQSSQRKKNQGSQTYHISTL